MDLFKEPLYDHLKAEPGEIVALTKYSTTDKPIDILGIADAAGKLCHLSVAPTSNSNRGPAVRKAKNKST